MDEVERVLVVDDHPDASELLCIYLERLGLTCREAQDGQSALAVAAELAPHVAIIDLWLPDMTGHDVARVLRQRDPRVFLIALTGSARIEDRVRALDAGFDEYLVKPADRNALRDVLAKARQRRSP